MPLGSDALAFLRHRYQQSIEELDRNGSVSRSTDFDGLEVSATGHALLEAHAPV